MLWGMLAGQQGKWCDGGAISLYRRPRLDARKLANHDGVVDNNNSVSRHDASCFLVLSVQTNRSAWHHGDWLWVGDPLAATLWPDLPAATGMALVALGATQVTLARFRGTAAIVPVTLLHLAAYGGLYTLFVGATLHAATTRPNAMLGAAATADIALSIVPIGLALQCAWCQLCGDQPAA